MAVKVGRPKMVDEYARFGVRLGRDDYKLLRLLCYEQETTVTGAIRWLIHKELKAREAK